MPRFQASQSLRFPSLEGRKGKERRNSPLESPENDRCRHELADAAPAQLQVVLEYRQRDPAREPEDHGHGIEGQDGEFVRGGGEEARGEGEVEQGQEGPDGDEDEEVDAGGGGVVAGIVVVPVRGWEQS